MANVRKLIVSGGMVVSIVVAQDDDTDFASLPTDPGGVQVGATDNGDGTYTNPVPPSPTQAEIDAQLDQIADEVMTNRGALRALALVMLGEINTLRAAHGLPQYTATQLRTAVRNRING